ncbi:MAG: DUF4131 domain-containing protein [Chloroflexi bacterium]|nr:DUF4131 domain-containing protein [Chloroflexota bacterium]
MTIRLPLLWLSLAFLAGLMLAGSLSLSLTVWLVLAGASLLLAGAASVLPRLRRGPGASPIPVVLWLIPALVFLGGARYQASQPQIDAFHVAWYNDRTYDLLITGTVVEPPDTRESYTNLRLQVTGVDTGQGYDFPASGLLLARVDSGEVYHYGDILRLRGRLETPPEDEEFSYRDYLARQGIHAYMPEAEATRLPGRAGNPVLAVIFSIKDESLTSIYRIFPDPEASLLAGILLGVDTGLPADLQQAFKDTGTAHIIAISGFNIAILSGLLVSLFSRALGPRRGVVAAIAGIALYTILVGADAAVVRAAVMGTLSLFARQVGRRQDGLNTLGVTAAVMSLFNPYLPWDVGFQLSFSATLGLILYAQPFQQAAEAFLARRLPPETAQRVAAPLAEYFLFTLAAQLTTLPVMAYHFGRISLVSLVANPFILPAQPPVMVLGGLALLVSLAYIPAGRLVALTAWPFTAYTIRAVELFDRLPGGVLALGDFSALFVFLFYAILLVLTFGWDRVKNLRPALKPALLFSTLGVLTVLVWRFAAAAPDGRLHLTFLEVGSAHAILIQTPSGRAVLVNGGPGVASLSDGLGRRLPPFNRRLDFLVVASTGEQELAALPRLLERFPPAQALWAGNPEASYASRQLDETLTGGGIPVVYAAPGVTLDLGEGARLEVLDANPRGALLLVAWEGFRALLPLGVNFAVFEEFVYGRAIGPVTALLLAESGYAPANPPDWIENLRPQVVILSVAADDPFGLPDPQTLEILKGFTLLRTDRDGWIHLTTDGRSMWVESAR